MATRLSIRELRAALDAAGIDSTGCTERRELEHLHKIAGTLPRLLIFGDSWARADPIPTWPALVAAELGWSTLNLAMPGSGSRDLRQQAESLAARLQRGTPRVHEDAWAIVHTGGNDILRSSGRELIGFVASVAARALCPCACCCPLAPLELVAANVADLLATLHDRHGVKNFVLVGLPLAPQMPLLARMTEQLLGEGACVQRVGGFVLWRLAAISHGSLRSVLRAFERERRADGAAPTGIVVDERSAIVEALGGDGGSSADRFWFDGLHPSPEGHRALAAHLVPLLRPSLERREKEGGRERAETPTRQSRDDVQPLCSNSARV